jgi:hypothetical protein
MARSTALAGAQPAARQLNCESVFRGVLSYGRGWNNAPAVSVKPRRSVARRHFFFFLRVGRWLALPALTILSYPQLVERLNAPAYRDSEVRIIVGGVMHAIGTGSEFAASERNPLPCCLDQALSEFTHVSMFPAASIVACVR